MWMVWNNSPWWVTGALLVCFGLLIALFPQLLIALIASAFVFVGASMLLMGWSLRRAERRASGIFYREWERWPW